MCQAYAGERSYLFAMERAERNRNERREPVKIESETKVTFLLTAPSTNIFEAVLAVTKMAIERLGGYFSRNAAVQVEGRPVEERQCEVVLSHTDAATVVKLVDDLRCVYVLVGADGGSD